MLLLLGVYCQVLYGYVISHKIQICESHYQRPGNYCS